MTTRARLALALQSAAGSAVSERYNEIRSLYGREFGYVRAIAHEQLEVLLAQAVKRVKFYRERVHEPRPTLTDFPVVSKQDLRDSFDALMSDDLAEEYRVGAPSKSYSWIRVQTGGSTGEPVTVIHDRETRDRGRALRMFVQDLSGFPFGVPFVKLWGSMPDIRQERDGFPQRVLATLSQAKLFNAFSLGDSDMRTLLQFISARRIRHMMAYVDAAHTLARFALRTGSIVALDSVMACAGTITPQARSDLQAAFGGAIHNKYGSRECTEMACECSHGRLHEHSAHVWLEVVDEAGRAVSNGVSGRLLVTMLGNHSFPLIRYEIGDVAALSTDRCDCGYPTRLLDRIEGRSVEFLTSTDGRWVSPVFVRHLVGVEHGDAGISRFQLVQQTANRFLFRAEMRDVSSDDPRVARLIADLRLVLGLDAQIDVSLESLVEETASGKFLYTLNASKRGS